MMNDLFGPLSEPPLPPGARLIVDFISARQEAWLVHHIDTARWDTRISRRRQWYGTRYDATGKPAAAMPRFLSVLALHLCKQGLFAKPPPQVLINEYWPGQGIAEHIDRTEQSGDTVASLSLLSDIVMDFGHATFPKRNTPIVSRLLPARSLLVLRDEARYRWTHGIAKRQNDKVGGQLMPRARRISVTFRNQR